jgi:hypothetical protein
MENNFLKIEMTYCKRGKDIETKLITPEDYFDPLEDDEILDMDSTPKYLEQYQYINGNFEDLSWTKLQIYDSSCSRKMISEEKYWGEKNCYRTNIVSVYEKDRKIACEQTIEIYNPENEVLHIVKIGEPTATHIAGILSHTIVAGRKQEEEVIIVNIN